MEKEIEVTPEMVKAGIAAWGDESSFYGPPDVEGEPVVTAIYKAMITASSSWSEVNQKSSD